MINNVTYRDALRDGIRSVLQNDKKAFLIGGNIDFYGGAFGVSDGLQEEFGKDRLIDVPSSETGFVGAGIGAAIGGMRPIIEIMSVNVGLLAMDQIIHNASTLLHMSGGQVNVPIVIRMNSGIGNQLAAQHSHSWEPFFAHVPGLIVLAAGTHEDARGMIQVAIKNPDPVIIFEYATLMNTTSQLSTTPVKIDINKAKIERTGSVLSILTYGSGVYKSLNAARELSLMGIDVEVVNLRILNPLDNETIFRSIKKTGHGLIVEDAWRSLSVSSELMARIMEYTFFDLKSPIQRLCGIEVPIPYPKHLENISIPQQKDIVATVKKIILH